MFKADLIDVIAKKTGNTKRNVEDVILSFIETVTDSLTNGEDVSLIGFGSFKVVGTEERIGRNPRTGKELKIPASKKVKFVVGKTLKETVKKGKEPTKKGKK